jgi:hypothetical protein
VKKPIFGMRVAWIDTMRPLHACWNNVNTLQWRIRGQTRLVSLIDSTLTAEARGAGSSAEFCRYF